MATSISLTTKRLRELDIPYWICEYRHRHTGQLVDLLGFIDILAFDQVAGIIGIQAGLGGHAGHRKKILGEMRDRAQMWLGSGGRLQIWTWRLAPQVRGSKKLVYKVRIETITSQDLQAARL